MTKVIINRSILAAPFVAGIVIGACVPYALQSDFGKFIKIFEFQHHAKQMVTGPIVRTAAQRKFLDFVARSEGTFDQLRNGYDTSLGYGRFMPGQIEQSLTCMTLNEIINMGFYMRSQPGNPNSSALGRYQIVGDTLRDLIKRLGLSGSELFNPEMQDMLALELLKRRGANTSLANEWSSLKGWRLTYAIKLARRAIG